MTELLTIVVILIAVGIAANKWGQVWIDQTRATELELLKREWRDEGY